MKKIFIVGLLLIFLPKLNVKALSTSISSSSTLNPGDEITLTVKVSNAENLMGMIAKLDYDKSKLELKSYQGLNGFNLTIGTNIVLDSTSGKNGAVDVATLKFKTLSGFAIDTTTGVSINNVTGSNGEIDIQGSGSSKTITMKRALSTNNYLKELKINDLSISKFSKTTTSYTVVVKNNVSSIKIGGGVEDERSTISGVGTKSIKVYDNYFSVVVTSESGSKKTYSIKVVREDSAGRTRALSTNNFLSSISIDGYELGFDKNKNTYEIEVENTVNNLDIKFKKADEKATTSFVNKDLKVGINNLSISVTSENGEKNIYKVIVTRKSDSPETTFLEIKSILKEVEAKQIIIKANETEDQFLDKDLLRMLFENKKSVIVNSIKDNRLLYSWSIESGDLAGFDEIETEIRFTSENKKIINEKMNYADMINLNFSHSGDLPKETFVKVYVGDKYQDGDMLKLYYFDKEEELSEIYSNLVVQDGYVEFELEHCSEYFLTMANMSEVGFNFNYLLYFIVVGQTILVGLLLFDKFKKKITKTTKSML